MMEKPKFNLKKEIARKRKVEAAQQTEGRTSLYNPLLQKPVALEPVGPGSYPAGLGGYAYIGPPPDFGGSYGCYEDTQGRKQYGVKSSKQFSIYDGSPSQLKSELSADERKALLSQMDDISESYKCESCRAELTVSAFIQADKVHCPYCSSQMEGAVEKIKQCYSKLEEKNMSTKPKEAVKAEADLAKEAMKMDAPKDVNEAVPTPKEAKPLEPSAAEKDCTMLKEADCGLEGKPATVKSSEEDDKEAKEKEAKAAKEKEEKDAKEKLEASTARKTRIEAAKKAFENKKRQRALASLRKKKEVKAQAESTKAQALKRSLRIMAALEPAKFALEKAKPQFAAICAEVESKMYSKADRAKVRAELATMAEQDPEAAEDARKKLEFIAPEILMEEDVVAPKIVEEIPMEAKEGVAVEPKEGDELAPVMEDEKAEAMKTEFLASLSTLKGERVEMSLFGETTENPFWNVIVDAEPVGRIYLQDQENNEQIRAGFVADSYAENLGTAMNQVGVEKMLTLTKARLFAHAVDNTESMARVKAAAKLEAKAEFDAKVQTVRQDFVHACQIAIAATEKNLYKDEAGHALKGGLFNALAQLSIEPNYAVWAIEAGFESAPEYLEFVSKKAIEIMDMPQAARDSFENIVKASGKQDIAASIKPEEETLRDRLIKSSHNVSAMGGDFASEDKNLIRSNLNLSPYKR